MEAHDANTSGVFEPMLGVTFLPRCGACGGAHPLARKPPLAVSTCPDCGAAVAQPGTAMNVPAVVTGRSCAALLARALFGLGRFFFFFAKGR